MSSQNGEKGPSGDGRVRNSGCSHAGDVLRTAFVLILAAIGFASIFQGAFYALLMYLWVAYFRPEAWVWDATLLKTLNLSYVAGLLAVLMTLFTKERVRPGLRVGLLALMLGQAFISTMFAEHTAWAWFYWLDFLKVVTITALIATLITDAAKFRLALLVLAVSLAFEPAKQGWVGLLTNPGSSNMNTHVMLGDNNGVAVGMMMLVPIFAMLAATSSNWRERLVHRVLGLGVLYHGIVTYSRGAFLACLALCIVYLVRSPRKLPVLAGILAASLLVAPVLPQEFWDRMGTITVGAGESSHSTTSETTEESDGSVRGRIHFWNVAIAMANARPFFGVGHNAYNTEYDRYDDSDGAFGRQRSVHSIWFGIVSELGYPGLLLFVLQLILAFHACALARRAARRNAEHQVLARYAVALEAAFVAYAVGGTFLPFQYLEMYWHFIGLSIALHALAQKALASDAARRPASALDVPAISMGLAS